MTGVATTGVAGAVKRRMAARSAGLFERWREHYDEVAGSIPASSAERSAQEVG
jgi:hypothetical protein